MKTRLNKFALSLLSGSVLLSSAALAEMTDGPVITLEDGSTVQFNGVSYDDPAPGESTWFYTIQSAGGSGHNAISHVVWEANVLRKDDSGNIIGCVDFITPAEGGSYGYAGTWTDKNAGIAGRTGGASAEANYDSTTNITGIKLDDGYGDNEIRQVFFSINGNYNQQFPLK